MAPRTVRASVRPYSTAKPTSTTAKITLGLALGLLGAESIYLLANRKDGSQKTAKIDKLIEKTEKAVETKVPQVVEEVKSAAVETASTVSDKTAESVAAISEAANTVSEAIAEAVSESDSVAAAALAESISKLEEAVAQLENKFDDVKDPEKLKEVVRAAETKFENAVDEVVDEAKTLVTEKPKNEEEKPQQDEEEGHQQAAYNPETGEINWDCPCLGGMAHGPCGEEFKAAFSCFVYSESEPKGMDCIEKFELMRSCFRKYPEVYREQLYEDDDEPEPEPVSEPKA